MNFPISPYEFPGATYDPAPHAFASLDVGGKTRAFGLKMRAGVIYFKEDGREPVWAITKLFPDDLKNDENALIQNWRDEMARENYGRYVARNFGFSGTGAHGVAAMIHRADGAGWIKEYFDDDWRQTPKYRGARGFDVWGAKYQTASQRAIRHAMPTLLDRALPSPQTLNYAPRWSAGDAGEVERLFALAVRAFTRLAPGAAPETLRADFEAHGIRGAGGFRGDFAKRSHGPQFAAGFKPFLQLVEEHCVWSGWTWQRVEPLHASLIDAEKIAAGERKWGAQWRGHFEFEVPSLQLRVPVSASLSAHETLETQLELRAWLSGKVAPARLQSLLQSARAAGL